MLICVKMSRLVVPVKGSTEGECCLCRNRVWMTELERVIAALGLQVFCFECASALTMLRVKAVTN